MIRLAVCPLLHPYVTAPSSVSVSRSQMMPWSNLGGYSVRKQHNNLLMITQRLQSQLLRSHVKWTYRQVRSTCPVSITLLFYGEMCTS